MTFVLFLFRGALAIVFATAGVAKLADRRGTMRALNDFHVPPRFAGPAALVLPIVELTIAAALIPVSTAWVASIAAVLLLLVFTAAIARTLLAGEHPDCRCFGEISPSPVGWHTLLRNGVLIAVASAVAALGRDDAGIDWMAVLANADRIDFLGAAIIGLLAVIVMLQMKGLARQRDILARIEELDMRFDDAAAMPPAVRENPQPVSGLPVGSPAPEFALRDLGGTERRLPDILRSGRALFLAFVSPRCGPCEALVGDLRQWQEQRRNDFAVVVVSTGSRRENERKFSGLAAESLLLQTANEVADEYGSPWTPSALLVKPNGRIASTVAHGVDGVRQLAFRANEILHATPPPAPALALPDLDGGTVDLRDYRGRDTLVLFWRPACSYCQRLLGDIRRWEATRSDDAPQLLVVSSESVAANRALGFRSAVALDESFATGRAFHAAGTPSAVLVDADGRIASVVAAGPAQVLALAGAKAGADAEAARVAS